MTMATAGLKPGAPKVIWNGKLEITGSHEVPGVTPAMMLWWSVHRNKERYKMWHPDHIDFKVLYKPEKGHIGSVYIEKEKHGSYMVNKKLVVVGMSDNSFTVRQNGRGYIRLTHIIFEPTATGMIMNSTQIIGSDNQFFGRFWNWVTRTFLYTKKYRAAAAKHGVLENESVPKFLPKLYAEYADKEPL